MRFIANGPSIPDELLVARDEGRVVYFCGAGISQARAGRVNFSGLAKNVIDILGVTAEDPARKIIDEAKEFDRRTGTTGLISVDRIFGLLERNFHARDIEAAVARTLKPSSPVDLSAHRIMLDLARGPDGKVRLITTNFDLLFESCDISLKCFRPPRLPDPQRYEEFMGIIHLHGHVDKNYKGASGDGFILSSSGFGRAYLSEGWATSFIKSVLDKYVVVFIGYAADDPPVQYLLEAMKEVRKSLHGAYAFQPDSSGEGEDIWRSKGVNPIPYNEKRDHGELWDTLEAWSKRAKNPEAWYKKIITLARKGPEVLSPHIRGQVAHIVSTFEGAHRFFVSEKPPPADWLCVFDPMIRYSKPGHLSIFGEEGPYFDPFEAYGLDSDPPPPKLDPNDHFAKREIPEEIWDCFMPTRLDQKLQDINFAALRGRWSVNVPNLPARLYQLGLWISKVSNQPAAVWWVSAQAGIHPLVQNQILIELERNPQKCSPEIRRAWHYIFEAWRTPKKDFPHDWYQLKASIDLDGWTNAAIREFAFINRPYLTVEKPSWSVPKPPKNKKGIRLDDLVKLDVEYPNIKDGAQIPDIFLSTAVREFRKNLEHAVSLEEELGGYGLYHLCSIAPESGLEGESTERTFGISPSFLFYVDLLKRLIDKDPDAARQEYLAWRIDDKTVFTRLRIWISGDKRVLSDQEAGQLISNLSDRSFWDGHHQRDLLLVLAKRWNDLLLPEKKLLEERLLRGRSRKKGEKKGKYIEDRAGLRLNRIYWMEAHGCQFTFDLNAETAKLRELAPEWQQQYAEKAAASLEGRGGWVRTDTEFSPLIAEPLDSLLNKAKELSGRTHDWLIETDPFKGLILERPVRAFSSLIKAAKRNEYPEWAWRKFLNSELWKTAKPRFFALVAEHLSKAPISAIFEFIYPVSSWLLTSSKVLFPEYPEQFWKIWEKLIAVLKFKPESGRSGLVRDGKERHWVTEAINAPAGKLAEALMNDPATNNTELKNGFPDYWLGHIEELLSLEGDLHRHVLILLTFNLNWFFAKDPIWTEMKLISVLDQDGDDRDAFWAGFFWSAKVPSPNLYKRIKIHLLELARQESINRRVHCRILSGILLLGWGNVDKETGEPFIFNTEMRDVLIRANEDFRLQTLWQLKSWSAKEGENGWKSKLPRFLNEVWPRQKKTNSPKVSAALCDLAFSDTERFSEISELILPLVTEINREEDSLMYDLKKSKGNIIERFPEKVLAFLFTILSEKAEEWPYMADEILERIGKANSKLLVDGRLIELKRRWNAR